MMNTDKIKEFANYADGIIDYFKDITPTKVEMDLVGDSDNCGFLDLRYEEVTKIDKDKALTNTDNLSFSLSELESKYLAFKEEMDYNIMHYSDNLNVSILERLLGNVISFYFHPTDYQLIDADMMEEAEMLHQLKYYQFVLNNLTDKDMYGNIQNYWTYKEELEAEIEEKASSDIETLTEDLLSFYRNTKVKYSSYPNYDESKNAVEFGDKMKSLFHKIKNITSISENVLVSITEVVSVDLSEIEEYYSNRFNGYDEALVSKVEALYYLEKISDIINKTTESEQSKIIPKQKKSSVTVVKKKTFRDILLCDEDKKDALIEKLMIILNGATPRDIAKILEALSMQGYIVIPEDKLNNLYKPYFNTFGYEKDLSTLASGLNYNFGYNEDDIKAKAKDISFFD